MRSSHIPVLFTLLATAALLCGGCSSSYLASNLDRSQITPFGRNLKFNIKNVTLDGAAAGGAKEFDDYYSAVNLNNMLRQKYPDAFRGGRDAIPINVDVSMSRAMDGNNAAMILSLGIASSTDYYFDNVRVRVTVADDEFKETINNEVEYKTLLIFKCSVYSPLGLISPGKGRVDFAVHDEMKGNDWGTFYRRQLVGAIVLALQNTDPKLLDALQAKWQLVQEKRAKQMLEMMIR